VDLAGLEMGLFASGGTGRLPPFLYICMCACVRFQCLQWKHTV
jgi:hypothetical protein